MPIKVDYVARETASNLKRNFTITLASILTVFVSLFLVGFSLLFRQGVEKATERWQGGIEFIVFLHPDANPDQINAVRSSLDSPDIERITFVDQNAAYDEFRDLFRDQPDLLESVTPDVLPPSFRVVPVDKDARTIEELSSQYETKPGVKKVVSATETIKLVQRLSNWASLFITGVAFVLLGVAVMLILNTIRMAMFARRREIEVMKLVGATNWFIRVPFMLEGLIQGAVGAGLAIAGLVFSLPFIETGLPSSTEFPLFAGIVPPAGDRIVTYVLVGIVGCIVGAVGAGAAVTRFLDV